MFKVLLVAVLTLALAAVSIAAPGRARALAEFKTIVIDVRGSRGGNGDVAAGYLTALDLVTRIGFEGNLTLLIDDKSRGILSKLLGREVTAGSRSHQEKLHYESLESYPASLPAPDLYLNLASPVGELRFAGDLPRLRVNEHTVLITQTVLGNTENPNSRNPFGYIQYGDFKSPLSPAGLGANEQGIHHDVIAAWLRGRTLAETGAFVEQALTAMPENDVRATLSRFVRGDAFAGAMPGLVYGITHPDVKPQFESYLEGISINVKHLGESAVLLTPSNFALEDIANPQLRKLVTVVASERDVPKQAKKGRIYLVKTGTLPHEVFVGLMAFTSYAGLPSLVSGDGAMSAAIVLGRPFLLTRVDWNSHNIENLKNQLSELSESPVDALMFDRIYGRRLDLGLVRKLSNYKQAFQRLRSSMVFLTDSMLAAAVTARELNNPLIPPEAIITRIHDPALKMGALEYSAAKGNAHARLMLNWARERQTTAGCEQTLLGR